MSTDIQQILAERGSRYGRFDAHALVTQQLKQALTFGANWNSLEPDAKEALEMIVHKIGRILSGDPDYDDSWLDISGYSQLIVDRIRRTGEYASDMYTGPLPVPGTVVEVHDSPPTTPLPPKPNWNTPSGGY